MGKGAKKRGGSVKDVPNERMLVEPCGSEVKQKAKLLYFSKLITSSDFDLFHFWRFMIEHFF